MSKIPKNIYLIYVKGKFKNDALREWLEYEQEGTELVDEDVEENPLKNIHLYAWTFSKKYMKEFMLWRNSSRFIVVKKNARDYFRDDSDVDEFERKLRTQKIQDYVIITRRPAVMMEDAEESSIKIKMYLTNNEIEFIQLGFEGVDENLYILSENIKFITTVMECMTRKAVKSCVNIGIPHINKRLLNLYRRDTSIDYTGFDVDELAILMGYYSELFIGG